MTAPADLPLADFGAPVSPRTPWRAYGLAALLMAASAFSFLDRLVLSLVIDPIRHDLHLSDTQVSVLAGLAFAISYVVFAFPFGWWADTRRRKGAVVFGVTLWSLATAACGLAGTYARLFAARLGVGVGEASLNPAAYSMLPDAFPAHRRGLAMSIYACGASVGGGLAILCGAVVVQWATKAHPVLPVLGAIPPWRLAFLLVGLPGLLMAALIALTAREPQRNGQPALAGAHLGEAAAYLSRHAGLYAVMFLGFSGFAMNGYAFQVWGPAYFMRLHHLSPVQTGLLFGAGYGVGGTAGIIVGGLVSDAMVRRGVRDAPILVGLASIALQAPLFLFAYLSPWTAAVEPVFVAAVFGASLVGGLQAAMVQLITPARLRGLAAALYGVTVNFMGLGVAPVVVAALSDHVFGGPTGIGRALAANSALSLAFCALMIVLGLPAARRRAAAVEADELAGAALHPAPVSRA